MRRSVVLLVAVAAMLVGVIAPAGADTGKPEGVGLHDVSTGEWHLLNADGTVTSFYYGNPGDYAISGDWDCNGTDTPGLYRQSDGFVYLRNSNTQGNADIRFFFGNPGDVPLAGDFNGDGCGTVSIWRPSLNRVYAINKLGQNDGGLGAADFFYDIGDSGDRPFVGDFNGSGVDSVGLHRPSTSQMFIRNSLSSGPADAAFSYAGQSSDLAFYADWDGNGTDTVGVFQALSPFFAFGGAVMLRNSNTAGNADYVLGVGLPGWRPIAGVFKTSGAPPPPAPPKPNPGPALPPTGIVTVADVLAGRAHGDVVLQGAVVATTSDSDEFIFSDGTGRIQIDLNTTRVDPASVVLNRCVFIQGSGAGPDEIEVDAMVPCT
jgi:uncharacterized protein YdeI (BOF family)